jgi:magnesium-protoporphyrin IX monomethyl ester (oxidative) cyclase
MLHHEMGLESTSYDYTVFRITNEITRQVFPIMLDIDNPAFRQGLERMFNLQTRVDAAKKRGGVLGLLQRGALMTAAFGTFVRLYTLPVLRTEVTAEVRMAPAW